MRGVLGLSLVGVAAPLLLCQSMPAGAQGTPDPRLIGKWHGRTQQVDITVEFRNDGTYDLLFILAGPNGNEETRRSGQFSIRGEVIEFASAQGPVKGSYKMLGDDQMELTDEYENAYVLQRVGAGGATPAPQPAAGLQQNAAGTYAHPGGLYTLRYPPTWVGKQTGNPNSIAFTSPSGKAEVWISNGPGESLEGYHQTVFAGPIQAAYGAKAMIEAPRRVDKQGKAWVFGKAAVQGEMLTTCSITDSGGQYIGLIIIARAGMPEGELEEANSFVDGFSPGGAQQPAAQPAGQWGTGFPATGGAAAVPSTPAPAGGSAGTADGSKPSTVALRPQAEPKESAFTILVPQGWSLSGGVLRVNPDAAGGPAQSIEAKFDITLQSDPRGLVQIRWLPYYYFVDTRGTQLEGMFQPGTVYMGMPVAPQMSAQDFALKMVLPQLRSNAQNAQVVDQSEVPALADGFAKESQIALGSAGAALGVQFRYQAAAVTVDYDEGGVRFRETILNVMEYRGPALMNMWCNKFTATTRAPQAHFEPWAGIARLIFSKIQWNREWVRKELAAQLQRAGVVQATLEELARLDAEIAENRRQSNASTAAAMSKVIRGKEDAIDPATGDVTEVPAGQDISTLPDGTVVADDRGSVAPDEQARRDREGWKKWKPPEG